MIKSAVGLAHRPGRNTWQADIRRTVLRACAWILFREWIPLAWRQYWMFKGQRFAAWLSRLPMVAGASKGDTFENDLLKLIFQATAIANIADNAAASPLTNLYFSLHTSSPGDSGSQTTNEIAYTSYVRKSVARSGVGFTVTGNSVSPAAAVTFAAGTGGSGTATHFAIGTDSSGTGKILYHGTVTPNIVCGNGITPELTTATAITED
jgi:hypothetical protein